MMKIGIDISSVIYGTGVSVYTKNLVKALLKVDKENEYVLLGMSLRRQTDIKNFLATLQGDTLQKHFTTGIFPIPPTLADIIWNRLHIFSIENLVGKVDVFHSSDWTQPPSKAFKVTTIHDLSPIKYPQYTPKSIVDVHTRRLALVAKEVDRVIVPSQSVKHDAIKFAHIGEEKIRVIPEANDEMYKKLSDEKITKVKKKFGVKDYLLAVGTNPRKNINNIIHAFNTLKSSDIKLVVVGEKNNDLEYFSGVVYTGFVPDEEVVALYCGAQALIYASLDEGFGLPILHAFSCETPVVTSNISGMAEVAGNAAVLVDPKNVESISEGIKEAFEKANELIAKGKKRVKDFSWEKAARQTLDVYSELTS